MATMITRGRKSSKRHMLSRAGSAADWGGYVFAYGDRRNGKSFRRTLISLTIRGQFTEPVGGVSVFELLVAPEIDPGLGAVEIPCVGAWTSVKPGFCGGISLSEREFDMVLAMAVANKIQSVHLHFQEPRYGKSLIASVSFSSEPTEDD